MKNKELIRIAIVGATGAVGLEVLKTLEQRNFQCDELVLFASEKSAGKEISYKHTKLKVCALTEKELFENYKFVFFTAGGAVSSKHALKAAAAGAWVIDNSSFFRMHADVPLVVPEVNGHVLKSAVSKKLVANPNCTTAQMVMVLKPLHDHFKINRVVLSSYQAVSGKGQQGINEFLSQVEDFTKSQKLRVNAFAHPIAFNCLPHIDTFQADGFTGEEHKVMQETRKILEAPEMKVLATCVRVPVLNCHSESVSIETEASVSAEQARKVLEKMPGVKVIDHPERAEYPLAMEISGKDDVYVGRIRKDPSVQNGLVLWIVADNLRKGAALNAVQIAEDIVKQGL